MLKSGIVVPCGKCELCLSKRRNEWSVRLGVEAKYNEHMPLFITLTYDDEHLPMRWKEFKDGFSDSFVYRVTRFGYVPNYESYRGYYETLHRPDVSSFLKEYKRVNNLSNDNFHYFGCGEYGDRFGRPHYHLLFFGDCELQQLFDEDTEHAIEHIKKVWKFGNVHVCQAGFDGIHYVTKYCLKEHKDFIDFEQVEPFTIASKNLGASWFKSRECFLLKRKLHRLFENREKIYDVVDYVCLDLDYLKRILFECSNLIPSFNVELDDGRILPLPRYFRRKLLGQFEHFKDNPLWIFDHIQKLIDSIEYINFYGDYDSKRKTSAAMQQLNMRVDRINQRLKRNKKPITNLKRNEGI